MTTHETDRPADYESGDEKEAMGGSDQPTDVQREPGSDTPADVADTDRQEPVEDEAESRWSREPGAVAEDTDEADGAKLDPEDAPDSSDAAVALDRTPGSGPLEKLAPADPETALDPGAGSYQDRWAAIQAGFIDDPRRTVESASALVAEVWDDTMRAITDERQGVDGRWQSTETSTDDLRAAMQDYRTLYTRYVGFTSH